jgi:ADP-heptose:LPS heptosyltransferase
MQIAREIKEVKMDWQPEHKNAWLNPIGGYGDMLVAAGVLMQLKMGCPDWRIKLIRRTRYSAILRGHPAISGIGHPPRGAKILSTAYWLHEQAGSGAKRPFQILARYFGLTTPTPEVLYMPGYPEQGSLGVLEHLIPWQPVVIAISPSSDSPRKAWALDKWECVVGKLAGSGRIVLQLGRKNDPYIRGAWSLLGMTSPQQAASIVARSNAVICGDTFLMHVAAMLKKPAVVLWGPTSPETYGYEYHTNIVAHTDRCADFGNCIGPENHRNYGLCCTRGSRHCMNSIRPVTVIEAVEAILVKQNRPEEFNSSFLKKVVCN